MLKGKLFHIWETTNKNALRVADVGTSNLNKFPIQSKTSAIGAGTV